MLYCSQRIPQIKQEGEFHEKNTGEALRVDPRARDAPAHGLLRKGDQHRRRCRSGTRYGRCRSLRGRGDPGNRGGGTPEAEHPRNRRLRRRRDLLPRLGTPGLVLDRASVPRHLRGGPDGRGDQRRRLQPQLAHRIELQRQDRAGAHAHLGHRPRDQQGRDLRRHDLRRRVPPFV